MATEPTAHLSLDAADIAAREPDEIHSQESSIIQLCDDITTLSRSNDQAQFTIRLSAQSNTRRRRWIDKQTRTIDAQSAAVDAALRELATVEDTNSKVHSERQRLLLEISAIKNSIQSVHRLLEREPPDSANDDVEPHEKLSVVTQIRRLHQSLDRLRFTNLREEYVRIVADAEKTNSLLQQSEFREALDLYRQRLEDADRRSAIASAKLAVMPDPARFEEAQATEAEAEADAIERQLNGSGMELAICEAAKEYHGLHALVQANAARSKELEKRQKRLAKSRAQRQRKIARDSLPDKAAFMRSLKKRSAQSSATQNPKATSPRTTSTAIFYSKRSVEGQAREIGELEVAFEAEREQAQRSWQAKIDRITELTKKSNEIDTLQVRYINARQDIDVTNAQIDKTIADICAFEKEQEVVYSKCKELNGSMEPATKGEHLDLRSLTLDRQEKPLERRKFKITEFERNLARMQLRANALAEANEATDARIRRLNDQIERVMSEVERQMREFDLFNMPSKVQD
jgi:hypothetical protein